MPIAPYVRRLIAGGCLVVAALALFQSGYAQSSLDCTTTVIVQPGDTLSLIAGRQVGSQVTYQAIVAATNDKAAGCGRERARPASAGLDCWQQRWGVSARAVGRALVL